MVGGISFLYLAEFERERLNIEKQILFFAKTGRGNRVWLFLLKITPQINPQVALLIYIIGITYLYFPPFSIENKIGTKALIGYLVNNDWLFPILSSLLSIWVLIWLVVRERTRYFLQISLQDLDQKKKQLGSQYTFFLREGIQYLKQTIIAKNNSQRQTRQIQLLQEELNSYTS